MSVLIVSLIVTGSVGLWFMCSALALQIVDNYWIDRFNKHYDPESYEWFFGVIGILAALFFRLVHAGDKVEY